MPTLHRRASEWYEQNGLRIDAICHAFSAKDFERAADLVELAWQAMDKRIQYTIWLGLAKTLPKELICVRPVLSAGYAWSLLQVGEFDEAEVYLRNAERWLESTTDMSERPDAPSSEMVVVDKEQFRSLPATLASARTYHAQALGDIRGAVKYGRLTLDLLPEEDHLQRGVAAALLGLAYWASGDLETAERTLADGMANMRMAGNILFAIRGTYSLADIRLAQGRLREAIRTYEQSLQLATEQGKSVLRGTADLYLRLSELYHEQGNLEAAAQHLLSGEELGEQATIPHWQYRLCLAQARIKEAQGDLDGAIDLLDKAVRQYVRTPVPDVRPIAAMKTRVWIAQGNLAMHKAGRVNKGCPLTTT